MTRIFIAIALLFSCALPAQAQTTGGVFGPSVNEGHRSAQYRFAFNAETDRWAQRLHYQQALNGDFQLRGVLQTRETGDSQIDFDFVQAELVWQISPDDAAYQTGLRFDARLRDAGRPGQIGVNWMHQWKLDEGWQVRLIGLSNVQIGDAATDGVGLAARSQVSKKLDSATLGLQTFSGFGRTGDLNLTKRGHAVGPFVATKFGDFDVVGRVLLGVTDEAADADLGLWIGTRF